MWTLQPYQAVYAGTELGKLVSELEIDCTGNTLPLEVFDAAASSGERSGQLALDSGALITFSVRALSPAFALFSASLNVGESRFEPLTFRPMPGNAGASFCFDCASLLPRLIYRPAPGEFHGVKLFLRAQPNADGVLLRYVD